MDHNGSGFPMSWRGIILPNIAEAFAYFALL